MSVGKVCIREVQVAEPEEFVVDAARRMVERGVGTVIVLDEERRPVGVLTDRDVMRVCVAEGKDPNATTVGTAMTRPVVVVREETPIEDALEKMAKDGVRRLVIVDGKKHLLGVLSLDDILELLAEESAAVGRLLASRAP